MKKQLVLLIACFSIFAYEAVVMQKKLNAQNAKFPPSGRVSRKERKKFMIIGLLMMFQLHYGLKLDHLKRWVILI